MNKSKEVGRITLFDNDKKGRIGAPDFNGKLITEKGEFIVDIWIESANTKTGRVLRGRVTTPFKPDSNV